MPYKVSRRDEAGHWRNLRGIGPRKPGGQIHPPIRTHLSVGDSGPGAPAADAARARPRRGSEHRGLHFRLSRLAARHLRQRAVAGQGVAREQRHPLPARPQRRPRRHRGVGQPAGRPVSRRHGRWRVRHLVRQRPRRRSLARRAAPRQLGRHRAARRRARHRRATITARKARPRPISASRRSRRR